MIGYLLDFFRYRLNMSKEPANLQSRVLYKQGARVLTPLSRYPISNVRWLASNHWWVVITGSLILLYFTFKLISLSMAEKPAEVYTTKFSS